MKFKKGDRVIPTASCLKQFPYCNTGRVVSNLGDHSIRVLRDGHKHADTWHDSFWKRAVGKESR